MRFIIIFSFTFNAVIALNPRSCIVMSGVIATIATMPNARLRISCSPQSALHAPIASGRIKLEVSGPLATPPESNAIAVYIFGTKKESPSDSA